MPIFCRKELVRARRFDQEDASVAVMKDHEGWFIMDYTGRRRPVAHGDWVVFDPVIGGPAVFTDEQFLDTYRPFPES